MMKVLMDEVRFEEGGVVVHMRKSTGESPKPTAWDPDENERFRFRYLRARVICPKW
jgi:hypothetical protein